MNDNINDSCGSWDGDRSGGNDDWIDCTAGTYSARILRAHNAGWQLPYQENPEGLCEKVCFLFIEVDEEVPEAQRRKTDDPGPQSVRYVLVEELPMKMNYGLLRSVFEAAYNNNVPADVKANPRLSHLDGKSLLVKYEGLTYKKDDRYGKWHAGDPKIDKKTGKQRMGITAYMPLLKGMEPLPGPFKSVPEVYGLAKWKTERAVPDDRAEAWNKNAYDLRKQKKAEGQTRKMPNGQPDEYIAPGPTDEHGSEVDFDPGF